MLKRIPKSVRAPRVSHLGSVRRRTGENRNLKDNWMDMLKWCGLLSATKRNSKKHNLTTCINRPSMFKMASVSYVLSQPLCFLLNNFSKTQNKLLKSALVDFNSPVMLISRLQNFSF